MLSCQLWKRCLCTKASASVLGQVGSAAAPDASSAAQQLFRIRRALEKPQRGIDGEGLSLSCARRAAIIFKKRFLGHRRRLIAVCAMAS